MRQGDTSSLAKAGPFISLNHYSTILASFSLFISLSVSLSLLSLSLSLSTVHKICLGVISPPTQENNERQWHDRLDIDEIAAVTICTSRLGPSFASEIEKGWRACVCVRVCMCESVGAEDGGGGKG